MECSTGQDLAVEQLADIAAESDGSLEIVEVENPTEESGSLCIRISVSTRHLSFAEGGIPFTAREGLNLYIPFDFPDSSPSAYFLHKRYAGRPHVQWGRSICLFRSSELEWNPSDGMYGFVQRLNDWLHAAALGQLDPDDAPLRPPANYPSAGTRVVIDADAPKFPNDQPTWYGTALFERKNKICLALKGWLALEEEVPVDQISGAVVLLNQPLPMEYPDTVFGIISALWDRDVPFNGLYALLRLYALRVGNDEDLHVVIGAPMRRPTPGGPLLQHLTVWQIPASAAAGLRNTIAALSNPEDAEQAQDQFFQWAASAKIDWCRVLENRPEVTVRRDKDTTVNWLLGKRVLLLGCGALGSPSAEFIVRAKVAKLTLVDYDIVTPGTLVRQRFDDTDIGFTKASALKVDLDRVKSGTEIEHITHNLKSGIFSKFAATDYDVVIDATASRSVARVLEKELRTLEECPPIVSMCVSARAEFGMVTVRMPEFGGGPVHVTRRTKIEAFQYPAAAHFARAFWPAAQTENLLQPEPGCSEPTFVGSSADMSAHSSALFNVAIERIKALAASESCADFIAPPPSLVPSGGRAHVSFRFNAADAESESRLGYNVFLSSAARKAIDSEILTSTRVRGAEDETGGLLFGMIDESLEHIYVDYASGPPPDSDFSPQGFECGVEGTVELVAFHKKRSGGAASFVVVGT